MTVSYICTIDVTLDYRSTHDPFQSIALSKGETTTSNFDVPKDLANIIKLEKGITSVSVSKFEWGFGAEQAVTQVSYLIEVEDHLNAGDVANMFRQCADRVSALSSEAHIEFGTVEVADFTYGFDELWVDEQNHQAI